MFRVFVLPNFAIEMITKPRGSGKVIFITTHSLGEMDEEIGKNYIHHVESLSDAALIINLKVGKENPERTRMLLKTDEKRFILGPLSRRTVPYPGEK